MKPLELYIHIPFCISKCKYCDFLSAPSDEAERVEYVESLCQKIRKYADMAKAYRVISIFVGGGTPSILETEQMTKIFVAVRETFKIENDAEITVEMNPGTMTREKFVTYKRLGVNRLSIGLQSANNVELKALGRIHTYEEFLATYQLARAEGFQNINIDLISAIPCQTEKSWEETLRKTAGLKPEHISAYSLIIEEGTLFYERYRETERAEENCLLELPDEDTERMMYENTEKILGEYGYHRYEISNYAKGGYECRHNLGYWNRTEYLGIGIGAASLMDNQRWNQTADMEEFLNDRVEPPVEDREILSVEDQMAEYMFLGLRKMEGVSKVEFEKTFCRNIEKVYGTVIKDMKNKGLLIEEGEFLKLTKEGINVSNYVMSEFLLE